jgi:hypothetical protein
MTWGRVFCVGSVFVVRVVCMRAVCMCHVCLGALAGVEGQGSCSANESLPATSE